MISLISSCTSFSVFSFFFPPLDVLPVNVLGLPPAAAASSVWISNCQRSSVSSVSTDFIARTRRVIEDVRSHSVCQLRYLSFRRGRRVRVVMFRYKHKHKHSQLGTYLAPEPKLSIYILSDHHR
jgi:hypothetical protein